MILYEKQVKKEVFETPYSIKSYLDGRVGFWGIVKEVDSRNNTVTVMSDTGFDYAGIPVMSKEWVNSTDDKNYLTGERYLPRVGSVVFVLMPTHTITGAFVLCSGFLRGETSQHTMYASDSDEMIEKNNIIENISQGGWNTQEDYNNGNKKIVSVDENIIININPEENEDKEQEKEVSLIAWNNEIHITEDGINIIDSNGNNFQITENGITVIDSNNNKIETTENGINLYKDKDDTTKNYIKLGSKIEMKGSSGTLEIS